MFYSLIITDESCPQVSPRSRFIAGEEAEFQGCSAETGCSWWAAWATGGVVVAILGARAVTSMKVFDVVDDVAIDFDAVYAVIDEGVAESAAVRGVKIVENATSETLSSSCLAAGKPMEASLPMT
jgi:hypothetical protein